MSTATIIREEENGWRELLRPLFDMFGKYVKRGARRDLKPIDLWADDPYLQEALSAVRMAAYYGEEYEDVALRIDQEVARYREFLRSPTPIGKITLNTKRIFSDVRGAADAAADKYQVNDPVEGRADVSYSVKRFEDLVLEFVVHDQNDVPLFPIARTYSDWVGRKSFDLGAGRTFDLHMSEGECPAKVRVRAGITSADAAGTNCSDLVFASEGLPLAADEDRPDRGKMFRDAGGRSYVGRLALAFGIECLILFAFGWAYLRPPALTAAPTRPTPTNAVGADAASLHSAGVISSKESTQLLVMDGEAPFSRRKAGLNISSGVAARGAQRKREGDTRGLTRIAAVSGGRVNMDAGFCDRVGDLCNHWRAGMQSAYNAMRGVMPRSSGATADAGSNNYPEAVMVSYPSAGADKGHVQVTLLLADAFFLLRGMDCTEFEGGAKGSTDTISAGLPATGLGVCRGTESIERPAGGSDSATAETGVKSTDAE